MCLASTMLPIVLRVKELNGKSYTLYRRLHVPVNTLAQNMFSRDAKRLGFRAGTKHRSQVTENAIKKLGTLLGFLCLFICFISGYVTIRHIFGIDHASRCSKSKRTKYWKLHIILELEEFFLSFGFLETSKRGFIFTPRERTWIEVLRGECFGVLTVLQCELLISVCGLHTLLRFKYSCSILKPFKLWKRSRKCHLFITTTSTIYKILSLNFMLTINTSMYAAPNWNGPLTIAVQPIASKADVCC